MAKNMIYRYDGEKTRERAVPSGTQSGTPLLVNARPCVTLTARGDATRTETRNGITITYANGGVGNLPAEATVAYDGTWEFSSITGVTTSTGQDVAVYITSGGVLTLTSSGNTLYGYKDYPRDYVKAAGIAPVRIGA